MFRYSLCSSFKMINLLKWLSFLICLLTAVQALQQEALLYGSIGIGHNPTALDMRNPPLIMACPAGKQQEMNFNYNFSIGRESLFVKNVYKRYLATENMKSNICRNPIKPVTFYDLKNKIYEIGYELYHKDGQVDLLNRPQDSKFDHYVKVIFHRLAMPSKHPNNYENIKYQDNGNIKFKFFNGSRSGSLVFRFIPVWHINVLEKSQTMKITFRNWQLAIDEEFNPTTKTCKNYHHLKDEIMDDLFSEANQKKCLENLWILSSSQSNHTPNLPCGQPYGCLKKSQIIPDWYSDKHAIKLTYCTCMNFVPIWKTIADGQLKKVDLLIFSIINTIRNNFDYDGKVNVTEVNFGVSGVLKMSKKDNPENPQEILLWDGENDSYTIRVPRIIFKIIRMEAFDNRSAIIIVHNDPNPVPESDRICTKESEIPGWDIITNEDHATGLTYVCHLTPEIIDKLELEGTVPILDYPLNLEGFLPKDMMNIKRTFESKLRYLFIE